MISLLINQGHKYIGFIAGKKNFESSRLRKHGFIRALKDHHIDLVSDYMVQGDYSIDSGYQGIMKLLKAKRKPTAVFCCNDGMAFGAIKVIKKAGLEVPRT